MCVTNSVCKISLIKNVFKVILSISSETRLDFLFNLFLFFYAKTLLVANDFYYGSKLCDVVILSKRICCCQNVKNEGWLPSLPPFDETSLLIFFASRCFLSFFSSIELRQNFVDFQKCWDFLVFLISRIDLFQNNVFEILNDFCQKFEFRLWWNFSYTKLFYIRKRSKWKICFSQFLI